MKTDLPQLRMPDGRLPVITEGLRVYAIGDVHGCLDKLLALEQLIAWDARSAPGPTQLVMTGDYIDRGPQSREVIEHLAQVQDGRILLAGNHDVWLPPPDAAADDVIHWCRYGGKTTLLSYGIDVTGHDSERLRQEAGEIALNLHERVPQHHRELISGLKLTAGFGDYLFVHAGIRPGIALGHQVKRDLIFIREPFLSSVDDHGALVVHGHTPVDSVEILPNRIGIDTGAVFGGRLTALALEGDRRWLLQV